MCCTRNCNDQHGYVCRYKNVDKIQKLEVDELGDKVDVDSLGFLVRMILPLSIPKVGPTQQRALLAVRYRMPNTVTI